MRQLWLALLVFGALAACNAPEKPRKLPILGERDISPAGDTVFPKVPDFSFINQDSQVVNNATFQGKIYVADFFFIHCPTICRKVESQMLRILEKYKDDDRLVMLSHTIDPKNDTVAALKRHAVKLGIPSAQKWQLVTGDKDKIYDIADHYFVAVTEDSEGFDHSGRLILVDKNRYVRAFCEGTDAESVTKFFDDIDLLLSEK